MARQSKATPDTQPWVSLPPELYSETINNLVTFSHKTTNSNIPAGGVRLAPDQALKLPYVSARTLLAAGEIPNLDYPANTGKVVTAVKQLKQVQDGKSAAQADEARLLLARLADSARHGSEIGTERVSLRARQLLLPRPDGGYVATTPTSAGGVSLILNNAIKKHNESAKELDKEKSNNHQKIHFGLLKLGELSRLMLDR